MAGNRNNRNRPSAGQRAAQSNRDRAAANRKAAIGGRRSTTRLSRPRPNFTRSLVNRPRGNGRARSNGQGRVQTAKNFAPAAVSIKGMRVGMSDLLNHTISWLTGFIYVGNGTLGATNSVYFCDSTKTYTILKNIPVAGSDSLLGASYISDIEKHYARKRINTQKLTLLPLFPSTANSMTVIVAPEKGPGGTYEVNSHTDTTAANLYTNVLSMNRAKQVSSWEQLDIDLTPFIAGGSTGRQNEFSIDSLTGTADEVGLNNTNSLGVIPTTFAVSGNNSTTALQGTVTHAVVITQNVDLIDFLGGQVDPEPDEIDLFARSHVKRPSSHMPSIEEVEDEKFDHAEIKEKYADEISKFRDYLKSQERSVQNKLAEIKVSEVTIEDDFDDDAPTTTDANGFVKIIPRIQMIKSKERTSKEDPERFVSFPKSESFINQVKDLVISRSK